MGPLFSIAVIAIAAGTIFCIVAVVFRLFVSSSLAVPCAFGFVVGAGLSATLCVALLALTMGVGVELTGLQPLTYLCTLAISAVLGGAILSWQVARRHRFRW
jgi:hypothetical protein